MASALTELRNLGVVLGYWIIDDELRVQAPVLYHSSLNLKTAALVSESVMQLATVFEISAGARPEYVECDLCGHAVIARNFARGTLVVVCGAPGLAPDLRGEVRAIIERASQERALRKLQEKESPGARQIPERRLALLDPARFPPRMKEIIEFFFQHYQGQRRLSR